MIADIVGPGVVARDAFDDPVGVTLFPEEEAVIAKAVDKRRRQFTTVRHCAREALAELGIAPAPLVPGERGAPGWPDGVVGSMTHCEGYRAAVVALAGPVITVGIDAEPHGPLPDGVLGAVSLAQERVWLADLAERRPDVHWDRLLFSAKESVYKSWFPLTRKWLGFEDALITVDPDAGTFEAKLLVPGPTVEDRELTGFTGRWLVRGGLVATAITVVATRTE